MGFKIFFQRPSLHCLVFGAKLQGVNVKLLPSEGTQSSGATVQDLWESNFKKLGEENPEQSVTGFLLFYPHHLTGYLEVICMVIYGKLLHLIFIFTHKNYKMQEEFRFLSDLYVLFCY